VFSTVSASGVERDRRRPRNTKKGAGNSSKTRRAVPSWPEYAGRSTAAALRDAQPLANFSAELKLGAQIRQALSPMTPRPSYLLHKRGALRRHFRRDIGRSFNAREALASESLIVSASHLACDLLPGMKATYSATPVPWRIAQSFIKCTF